jgi:hypothetical protein
MTLWPRSGCGRDLTALLGCIPRGSDLAIEAIAHACRFHLKVVR